MIGASLAVLAAAMAAVPLLGSEFLPKLDEGNLWLTITLPPSTALDKTKEVEREVRAILRAYPEVGNVVTHVGRPDDGTDPKGPNNIEIMADLKPRSSWRFANKEQLVADMSRRIRAMPGVPTSFSQVIEDSVEEALSGVKGEIAVKIFGPDLDVLEDKAEQVAEVIGAIRGAADVAAIKVGGATELDIHLDRERLARYGLQAGDVNRTVQAALGGVTVANFYERDRAFDVTVRLAPAYRQAASDVAELPVAPPGGGGGLRRRGRHFGAERRDHGGALHGGDSRWRRSGRSRARRCRGAAAAHHHDRPHGRPRLAARGPVAGHRLGNPAPLRGGDRGWRDLRHPVHAAAAAVVVRRHGLGQRPGRQRPENGAVNCGGG